jgi:hypothetical protein
VLNPNRFKESDGHISALQALLEKKHQIGDSAFYSEYQMEPKRVSFAINITPKTIVSKIDANVKHCCVPDGYVFTVCSMDLNTSYGATCVIQSFKPDGTSVVLHHSIYKLHIDQQLSETEYNKTLYNELVRLCKHIKDLGVKIDAMGIDSNSRNYEAVESFSKNSMQLTGLPCCGMMGKGSTNFNPLVRSRLRAAVDRVVLCGDEREHLKKDSGYKYLFFDSDHYREKSQRSFLGEMGSVGSTSLYNALSVEHVEFANQVCNEQLRWKKTKSDGRTEYSWKSKDPHDYGDCLAMNQAIAAFQGLSSSNTLKVSLKQQYRNVIKTRARRRVRIV